MDEVGQEDWSMDRNMPMQGIIKYAVDVKKGAETINIEKKKRIIKGMLIRCTSHASSV